MFWNFSCTFCSCLKTLDCQNHKTFQLQALVTWPCWMPILGKHPDTSTWANRSATVSRWTAACACPGTATGGPGHAVAAGHSKQTQLLQSTAGKAWINTRMPEITVHGGDSHKLITTCLLVFAVCLSCHQLRPLTVVQQRIQSSHDTTDLDPFLRWLHPP